MISVVGLVGVVAGEQHVGAVPHRLPIFRVHLVDQHALDETVHLERIRPVVDPERATVGRSCGSPG